MKAWLQSDPLCLEILNFLVGRSGFVDINEAEKQMRIIRHLGPLVARHPLILRSGFNRLQAKNLVVRKDKAPQLKISEMGREIHGELRAGEA